MDDGFYHSLGFQWFYASYFVSKYISLNGHIVVWPTVPHFNQLDKSTFCFTSNMVILWKKT